VNVKAARKARIRGDVAQLLRTGLLVFALALQGYLAQVHHHDIPKLSAAIAATGNSGATHVPVQPIDDQGRDPGCFFCHLSAHGSTSVLPPAILLVVGPSEAIGYRVVHVSSASHDAPAAYSSRAPPSLFVTA
jgi:hypothetical protein